MIKSVRSVGGVTIASVLAFPAGAADIKVGLITSMTGPGASIGIPYSKGSPPAYVYKDERQRHQDQGRFSSTTPPIRRPARAMPAS